MNIRIESLVKRRRYLLSVAAILGVAGLVWFSMLGGVHPASAYGEPNNGAQGGLIEEQRQQPPINACLFPGIPC